MTGERSAPEARFPGSGLQRRKRIVEVIDSRAEEGRNPMSDGKFSYDFRCPGATYQ
jgi:hypothetical protein